MYKKWVRRSNGKLIWLVWKLTCKLRTHTTCNPTVGFAKYEFNNKLLDGVIFFRITLGVTCTQPYII